MEGSSRGFYALGKIRDSFWEVFPKFQGFVEDYSGDFIHWKKPGIIFGTFSQNSKTTLGIIQLILSVGKNPGWFLGAFPEIPNPWGTPQGDSIHQKKIRDNFWELFPAFFLGIQGWMKTSRPLLIPAFHRDHVPGCSGNVPDELIPGKSVLGFQSFLRSEFSPNSLFLLQFHLDSSQIPFSHPDSAGIHPKFPFSSWEGISCCFPGPLFQGFGEFWDKSMGQDPFLRDFWNFGKGGWIQDPFSRDFGMNPGPLFQAPWEFWEFYPIIPQDLGSIPPWGISDRSPQEISEIPWNSNLERGRIKN